MTAKFVTMFPVTIFVNKYRFRVFENKMDFFYEIEIFMRRSYGELYEAYGKVDKRKYINVNSKVTNSPMH